MRKILIGILLGLSLGISFSLFAWVNPSQNPPSGGGVLQTSNTGLTINTSTYFVSGNVGIGTTNPQTKLHIEGGEFWLFNNGNNPRIIIGDNGVTGQYGYLGWDSMNDYYRIETDGTNGIKIKGNYVSIGNIYPSQPLIVGLGSTELFRVDTSGNVGIGTTAPSQRLTVVGNIGIQAGSNAFIGTLDNYALSLRTNNTDRVFITNAGNVGIGTTNPAEKLHVVGNARIDGNLYVSGSMPPGIKRITIAMYRNLQHNRSSWSPFLPGTANFCFDASKYPSGYTAYILVSWCASNASGGNDWAGVRLLNVTTGGVVWQDTASVGSYAAQPYCGDFYRRVNTAISLTNGHCYRFEGISEQGGQSVGIHIGDIYLDW